MTTDRLIAAAPCARCPFRRDVPIYLRTGRRREIAAALARGESFPCHAQVDYSHEDDDGRTVPDSSRASMCAGAVAAIAHDGGSHQFERWADRLGEDVSRVVEPPVPVWGLVEWQRLAEGATGDDPAEDDEEVEPCAQSDAGCLAPAGVLGSGGAIEVGGKSADGRCVDCDEPLCSACADANGRCYDCARWAKDDEQEEATA